MKLKKIWSDLNPEVQMLKYTGRFLQASESLQSRRRKKTFASTEHLQCGNQTCDDIQQPCPVGMILPVITSLEDRHAIVTCLHSHSG